MRNALDVTVQQAIVHITDRDKPAPICSDLPLDLAANGVLREYFAGQVRNALADEATAAARFAGGGPRDAREACMRILTSPASLVPASQRLALLLHKAMRTHPRIAPGSLAVCVYAVADDPSRSLALIKLDPGSALVQKVVMKEEKRLVSFDVRENVMPTTREKLHKAALVAPEGAEAYDLLLLDQQTAGAPAAFWSETFLNAALMVDGISGAKTIAGIGNNAALSMADAEEADTVREVFDAALRTPSVKRSALVKRLPAAARARVEQELDKRLPGTTTIPIDVEYAKNKLTNKMRFRGDYSFLLEFESDRYADLVTGKTTFDASDGTPMTRLTLQVPRLKRVK